MELLETQNPEKKRLIETSDRHKRELEKEVKSIRNKGERILTNALIVGGTLAIGYVVISQLVAARKKKKAKGNISEGTEPKQAEEEASIVPSFLSQLGTKVINQATLILLDIAKDQLMQYLESRKQQNENS